MCLSFTEQVEELQLIVSEGSREVAIWQNKYTEIKERTDAYKI